MSKPTQRSVRLHPGPRARKQQCSPLCLSSVSTGAAPLSRCRLGVVFGGEGEAEGEEGGEGKAEGGKRAQRANLTESSLYTGVCVVRVQEVSGEREICNTYLPRTYGLPTG